MNARRALADELRAAGEPEEVCEIPLRRAHKLESATSPEFRAAARKLVEIIGAAIVGGEAVDLVRLVESLARRTAAHARASWLATCRVEYELARPMSDLPEMSREHRRQATEELPILLAAIDERATSLTPEIVGRTLDYYHRPARGEKGRTVEGFAARLACECGAFDYQPRDQEKAQTAFRNLRTKEKDPP